MKCEVCRFVYNGPEIKCPYCGNLTNGKKVGLKRKYNFFGLIELEGYQIAYIILINVFILSSAINLALKTDYFWIIYTGLACSVVYFIVSIIFYKNLITSLRRFDFTVTIFIILWLILVDSNDFMAQYLIPCYAGVITVTELLIIVVFKKVKFTRNIFFSLWHALQITVPFILFKNGIIAAGAPKEIAVLYLVSFSLGVLVFANNMMLFVLSLKNKAREWIS